MSVYYSSIRSSEDLPPLDDEIDTFGGFVSYKSLPIGFMAYWNGNESWNHQNSDITSSLTTMAMAFTTLIERNSMGDIVRSFSLAKATSNLSAGMDWNVSVDLGQDQNLRWVRMEAYVPISHTPDAFGLEIIWFLSSTRGQVTLGRAAMSPRFLRYVIRIRDYPFHNSLNYLSLRVLAAHSSNNFTSANRLITSGYNNNALSVRLLNTAQNLANPNDAIGANISVSVTDWQPSPGFRNAVANSPVGSILSAKYGLNWDVKVADIAFPANARSILYMPFMGYRNNSDLSLEPPFQEPSSPFDAPVPASANHSPGIPISILFCIIALMLLALIV
jgi:hypothetical protein